MVNNNQDVQRNETHILAYLAAAKNAYAELMSTRRDTMTVKDQDEAVDKIRNLTRELDSFLTTGANDCDSCGFKPMGMLKTPAYHDRGVDYAAVYEVGCVHCPPSLVERPDGKLLVVDGETVRVKRRSLSARATNAQETVRKWNAKEFVEDFFFERIAGFTPVFAEAES